MENVDRECWGWWHRRQRIHLQSRRFRFDPWVRKIPWRKEWLPSLIFLPGESHGQRSLVGYSPWGRKESDTTERLSKHTHTSQHRARQRKEEKKKKQCRKKKQDNEDREVRKSHTMKTPDGHWPSGRVWIYFNQISKRQHSPKWQLGSMWQTSVKEKG